MKASDLGIKVATSATVTILGAIVAAVIVSQLPSIKAFIRQAWADDPQNPGAPWS